MDLGGLLIENIGRLATCAGGRDGPAVGGFENAVGIKQSVAVAVEDGKVLAIGKRDDLASRHNLDGFARLDAGGRLVTPGFVDCHTHPVFAGDRKKEFEMRNRGVSYEAIARKGGGIFSTVRATRGASAEELEKLLLVHLSRFLAEGTATLEAKSGYGLSFEDEMKQLQVIQSVQRKQPVELVPTFLGAHAIPPEFKKKRTAYVRLLVEKLLPAVAEKKLAAFCDVFVEGMAFSYAEGKEILLAAKRLGLGPKLHADQLSNSNGAELAAEVGAVSADHLEFVSDAGIKALKKSGTVAVLLPSASFYLRARKAPPVKKLLAAKVPLALASDFNPGTSPNYSLTFTMLLACLEWGLSAVQALLAVTRNAAYALGKGGELGLLAPGKQADLVIWDVEDYRDLAHYTGAHLTRSVVKEGKVVWQR